MNAFESTKTTRYYTDMPQATKSQISQTSSRSHLNHETRTTTWFDTTHVVAIGIDDYKNGVTPLEKAVNDAFAVAEIIKELNPIEPVEYYFSIASRSEATSEDIKQKVKEFGGKIFFPTNNGFDKLLSHLKEKVKDRDRIIVYFAGHGVALPFIRLPKENGSSPNGKLQVKLDDKPQGFLLFQDAEMNKIDTYVKMDKLVESLSDIDCRHGLMILDCCFGGTIEWSLLRAITRQMLVEEVTPSVLDRYITKNAWQILTSSSENQVTNESLSPEEQINKNKRASSKKTVGDFDENSSKNSPFVIALRDALLKGEADYSQPGDRKGFIHASELSMYLRQKVEGKSDKKLQTPCFFNFPLKHEQTAEFVFLLKGKSLDKIKEGLPRDPDINSMKNPYFGLESYSPEDYGIFFGRERLIGKLLDCVKKNRATGLPLTVVLGASGSGKSSLVKAGLISKMFPEKVQEYKKKTEDGNQQTDTTFPWQIFRPGRSPGKNLQEARKKLSINSVSEGKNRLLVIDQLEEVETQCEDFKQKEVFWQELFESIIDEQNKIDVVLTLRSDFETTLRNHFETALIKFCRSKEVKDSEHWVSARFPVPLMEREELEKVITKPAEKSVVFFEEKKNESDRTLIEQLIHEVTGMPGALPLLSVALDSMYKIFKERYLESLNDVAEKREIKWDDYKQLGKGGVTGAIRKKATEIYNDLSDEERKILRWVMMRMITRRGNQLPVRKKVMQTELEYPNEEYNKYRQNVIDRFIEERLLVSGIEGNDTYYEPAHDALVREWDYITAWLEGKEEPNKKSLEGGEEFRRENSTQKNQFKYSLLENLLTDVGNWFFQIRKGNDQKSQSFDLTLLQELNVAANTWGSRLPDKASKPSRTANKK